MTKKHRGNPVLTLRLPAWQIAGLKTIARESQTTVSQLLREQVDSLMWANNIVPSPIPLPGQISTQDLTE